MSIDAGSSRHLGNKGPRFNKEPLRRAMLNQNPMEQFALWYKQAEQHSTSYANPVSLATVSPDAQPLVRTVLIKGFDNNGFYFYTNYESRKGQHLQSNPKASMCFYWQELERQVIIQGFTEKLAPELSDSYFATRPKGSQIGAHISPQSSLIKSRDKLENEAKSLEAKYSNSDVPRPKHWGGYCLSPSSIEFWQGQPDRLHDRFIYERSNTQIEWRISRLAP